MTRMRCGGFAIIDRDSWLGQEIGSREVSQIHCVKYGVIEDP